MHASSLWHLTAVDVLETPLFKCLADTFVKISLVSVGMAELSVNSVLCFNVLLHAVQS